MIKRQSAKKPLKILHLLSQQPGKTGSGVYLLAMANLAGAKGYIQRAVIGIPGHAPLPEIPPLSSEDIFAVRFDCPPVSFAIPGMSDVMPYLSTRFSTFTHEMTCGYLQAFTQALNHAAKDCEPDIIHSNHLWLLTALARKLFPHIPICVSAHGTELRQLQNAPHLAPLVIPGCSAVDMVFALHEDNKANIMKKYGISEERIRITGAGFRDDLFSPDGICDMPDCRDELIIAYAGKISASKGVPYLIDAMRLVKAPAGKKIKLLLAGAAEGAEADAIRERALTYDNIFFPGALTQEKLAAVLRSSDVFVLPSFYEGLPLVVIESLACGCRLVVTDIPGMDSWMPEGIFEDGFAEKVPMPRLIGADTPHPDDLPCFVKNLAQALSRQLSESADCGRASDVFCRLDSLSWKGVFSKVEAAYLELIGL